MGIITPKITDPDFPLLRHYAQRVVARKPLTHFLDNVPPGIEPHPDPISFGGGMPNRGVFPVDSIVLNLREKPFQANSHTKQDFLDLLLFPGNDLGKTLDDLKPKGTYTNQVSGITLARTVITEESGSVAEPFALKDALQYQGADGFTYLKKFTRELIERLHKPARDDWSTCFVNGAGDGLNKIFSLFVDPGDTVLVEEFTFKPTVWSIEDLGGKTFPVELDIEKDGIDVDKLEYLLDNWAAQAPGRNKPKVLYTISTGQNPTGLTQTAEHRKRIYAICQKHDLIIVEDDPYAYLILPPFDADFRDKKLPFDGLSVQDYIDKFLHTSYLNIDTDGRVVRSETFSKMIAPGVRFGFVAANKHIINQLTQLTMLGSKFSSGLTATVVNSTIQYWGGVDGYLNWGIELSKLYSYRKNIYFEAFHQSECFKKGRISLIDASAGMFITIVLNYPSTNKKKYSELMAELNVLTYKNGIIVVPAGTTLALNNEIAEKKGNIIRTTFVYASNDDAEILEAAHRIDKSINELFEQNGW